MFCLFFSFSHKDNGARMPDDERVRLAELIRSIDGIVRAHVLTPAVARDRYYDDGPSPMLALQLFFADFALLEAAIGPEGSLTELNADVFSSLRGATGNHQVMLTRSSAVPPKEPGTGLAPGAPSCAFMVHYYGEPDDLNEWHRFYLAHHPAIMATFPDIREIEIYTRVDWVDALCWPRVTHFQRNKVVFDTPEALNHALSSPTRERMKEDRAQFPAFTGGSVHLPMACTTVVGPQFRADHPELVTGRTFLRP